MSQSSRVTQEFGAVIASLPISSVQALSASGAITTLDSTKKIHAITTTGAATLTLADGVLGQEKIIAVVVHGGNLVVTGNFPVGTNTLTFSAANQYASLVWIGGEWKSEGASAAFTTV
ncbi:hypothetical protein CCP3SC1AL1_3030002 [Gammaproteobacteria bacterium]